MAQLDEMYVLERNAPLENALGSLKRARRVTKRQLLDNAEAKIVKLMKGRTKTVELSLTAMTMKNSEFRSVYKL